MTQPGLRLLSLDGGGTRGLSTLYILRQLMSSVVLGEGANVRPCEYFDLIGGSSLSGLCALLFVRFCYTIDQAIDFLHDLTQKLDDVENFRLKVLREDVEDSDRWLDCLEEFVDPARQLEALRQGIIQDAWSNVIKVNIIDDLERYPHMEQGIFNFKSPSAIIESGRQKAFVVSSESRGYSKDGGFTDGHQYNVPMLHRTYECRHGDGLYTFYAVGLATVASPGIIQPGVIFPDFLATGKHTAHNPVRLVLEEASLLWPGLHIATLTSIGSGKFELYEGLSKSFSSTAANASLRICDENRDLAEELQKFVLPFDKNLALAYSRFDTVLPSPYEEYAAKRMIEAEVTRVLESAREATKTANVANILKTDNFPTAPEDQVALASLATLLHALLMAGHSSEGEMITDVISNFILYEAVAGEDGSFRKLALATGAEEIGSMINHMHCALESAPYLDLPSDQRSEGMIMNGLMAFGDSVKGGVRPSGTLSTLSDYVAAAYYAITTLRLSASSKVEDPRFDAVLRQLLSLVDMKPEVTLQLTGRLESLLECLTLAALCEAATIQTLRGFKGLSHNGSLIRRIQAVLLNTPLIGVSQMILGPIANMLAILIQTNNWSIHRDDLIAILLDTASMNVDENWSLVNLAVVRYSLEPTHSSDTLHCRKILSLCENFLNKFLTSWSTKSSEILSLSIKNGHFGLLSKCLRGEQLIRTSRISTHHPLPKHDHLRNNKETVLHQSASLGFPQIMKTVVEGLGMNHSRNLVDSSDGRRRTALHLACSHRAPEEIFRLLFMLGADSNLRCDLGRTPLHYCFPDQALLPPVYDPLVNMISDFVLPTIVPLSKPRKLEGPRRGEPVEPRIYDFRAIINQLLAHQADFTITDQDGMTPLHQAAKNGWGGNLDLFFLQENDRMENLRRKCLVHQDHAGLTILDHARSTGTKGGEDIIVSEMKKRGMNVPRKLEKALMNLETQYMEMKIPSPRNALPEPGPEPSSWPNIYQPPASSNSLEPNPSPALQRSQFSPVYVYQDPDLMGGHRSTSGAFSSGPNIKPNVSSATKTQTTTSSATSEAFGSGVEEKHGLYPTKATWGSTSSTIYDPSDLQMHSKMESDAKPETVMRNRTKGGIKGFKRFIKGKEKEK